jgi:hypothetical protein
MIDVQLREHGYNEGEVAALALMLPEPFRRHYLADRDTSPPLRAAQ